MAKLDDKVAGVTPVMHRLALRAPPPHIIIRPTKKIRELVAPVLELSCYLGIATLSVRL